MFDKFALRHDLICRKREWDEYIHEERLFLRFPNFTMEEKKLFYPVLFTNFSEKKKEFLYQFWKKHSKKIGFGFKDGESRKEIIVDLTHLYYGFKGMP